MLLPTLHAISKFERAATGRELSLFAADIEDNRDTLLERLQGRRVAIIGAAGSIASSVVKSLLQFSPRSLMLFDLNENGLVEIVRDLRSSREFDVPDEFAELPIGLGSSEFIRYFQESEPFDYIFNLSAMKHVRSEKDVYCLMRMVDTNVLFLDEFLQELPRPAVNFFSVSSDKAVNPANLMGASKMVMEKVLLLRSERQPFSTARFANVAFSNGSLPFGFLMRIQKRQPLAGPKDVKRYFISHEEAGQLCILGCVLGENADVFFPKLGNLQERTFFEIAAKTLNEFGYEAYECSSEDEARSRINELLPKKKWPCYFAASDTTGEKVLEEFHGPEDMLNLDRFNAVGIIQQSPDSVDPTVIEGFLEFARDAKRRRGIKKEDYVAEFQKVIPSLYHVEKGKVLDEKM